METFSSQPQQVDDWVSAGENIMKLFGINLKLNLELLDI